MNQLQETLSRCAGDLLGFAIMFFIVLCAAPLFPLKKFIILFLLSRCSSVVLLLLMYPIYTIIIISHVYV